MSKCLLGWILMMMRVGNSKPVICLMPSWQDHNFPNFGKIQIYPEKWLNKSRIQHDDDYYWIHYYCVLLLVISYYYLLLSITIYYYLLLSITIIIIDDDVLECSGARDVSLLFHCLHQCFNQTRGIVPDWNLQIKTLEQQCAWANREWWR